MGTVLQINSQNFIETQKVSNLTKRALRYLRTGFSVHLRGPAGIGKTTMAVHLANMLERPILLVFGDDEYKSSDLIGNQRGYSRKKIVDNYIHNVVKMEDEFRESWIDSRLTTACREGFTLVYDEFNRSRPEVNNVLLSALEEKLLVLPASANRQEYIRVHPEFRAIFTSNPEEYCGVHATQDALMDRLVTIDIPEPDEITQKQILIQKAGLNPQDALLIVNLVKGFQRLAKNDQASGLRAGLIVAKVCNSQDVPVNVNNDDFQDICRDVLLSRSKLPLMESKLILQQLLEELSNPFNFITQNSEEN